MLCCPNLGDDVANGQQTISYQARGLSSQSLVQNWPTLIMKFTQVSTLLFNGHGQTKYITFHVSINEIWHEMVNLKMGGVIGG